MKVAIYTRVSTSEQSAMELNKTTYFVEYSGYYSLLLLLTN